MNYLLVALFLLNIVTLPAIAQDCDNCPTLQLDKAEKEEFERQAKQKVRTLSNYIETIGNKSEEDERKDLAIDASVKLFSSEDNVVEVSNVNKPNTPPKRYSIRNYLIRLKMLPYDQVEITWYDINITNELTKRPDGRYEGVVSIWQRFSGKNNNEMGNYKDVTKKNIQVIVEKAEIYEGDEVNERWLLMLGDIKVQQTIKEN